MLASGSTTAEIVSAASIISCRPIDGPPVKLSSSPLAPSIVVSSKGLDMACLAAAIARPSPEPTPMPIRAEPAFDITVFTSAKSTLIRPGIIMTSEMPCTPCLSTSSATRNASGKGVFLSTTWSKRSLGIVMIASTFSLSAAIPRSACARRLRISIENGLVTTPTVSAPASRAISATIGAAPVPVPPPIPAVTKTMSAPLIALIIKSRLSSAAFTPMSGLDPAPSPRVSFSPICTLWVAFEDASAWASVFMAINSAPLSPASIMRLTALLPPPPTPITLILAYGLNSRSHSAISVPPPNYSQKPCQISLTLAHTPLPILPDGVSCADLDCATMCTAIAKAVLYPGSSTESYVSNFTRATPLR